MEINSIVFELTNKTLALPLTACDTAHAQAQALDIGRALDCDRYQITYTETSETTLAKLFKDLAFNNFTQQECCEWEGSYTNKVPCFYALGKRYYVRAVILKYLDIPRDGVVPKPRCGNAHCVNPYHFEYREEKNTKLSSGDMKMLLAFQSQGASVRQIAKALKVHRSTIYRKLNNEHLSARTSPHSNR